MGMVVVTIMILAFAAWMYSYFEGQATITDESFSQAGITVWFNKGAIEFRGQQYPLHMVRGIEFLEIGIRSYLIITLNDLSAPVHKFLFLNGSHAKTLLEKLAIAIEKAGGPHLS